MDAVGSGASVLAFVGVAVQSTKALYEFLNAIIDGPQTVKETVLSLQRFQSTLEQLAECRLLRDTPGAAARGDIESCSDDVERLAQRIKGLQITENERRTGRYWKKFKVAFKEKDLEKMNATITSHTTALTLRLSALQADRFCASADGLAAIDRKLDHHVDITSDQHQSQQNTLSGISSAVDKVVDKVQDMCTLIQDALTNNLAMSSNQATQMRDGLRQLHDQVGRTPIPVRPATSLSGGAVTELMPEEERLERAKENLIPAIDRLCCLVDAKEGSVDSEEAEGIVTAIQSCIRYLEAASSRPDGKEMGDKHTGMGQWDARDISRDLRTAEGLALSSRAVSVNQFGPRPSHEATALMNIDRKRKEFTFEYGSIALSTKRRKVPRSDDESTSRYEDTFTAVLSFLPKRKSKIRKMFTFAVTQKVVKDGVYSSIPKLFLNNILPSDSDVFTVVRRGNVFELQQMLREEKASLRDHDEDGASLLFYATRQPEMCKFLIGRGLDVDHVAVTDSARGWKNFPEKNSGTCLMVELFDEQEDTAELDSVNTCRRLILGAGSDILIEGSECSDSPDGAHTWHTAIAYLLRSGNSKESIQSLLDHMDPFATVNSVIDRDGRTPLLRLCSSSTCTRDTLGLLLKRGADIHATNYDGYSCLHECIWWVDPADQSMIEARKALVLLVKSGADVYAKKKDGTSVTELAYRNYDKRYGSVSADLWDSVLADCGYDVAEFRQAYPWSRTAPLYTKAYTRSHFESLWEGIEQFCPYYDEPGECLYSESDLSDDEASPEKSDQDHEGENNGSEDPRWGLTRYFPNCGNPLSGADTGSEGGDDGSTTGEPDQHESEDAGHDVARISILDLLCSDVASTTDPGYDGASPPTEHGELLDNYSLEGIGGFGETTRMLTRISIPNLLCSDLASTTDPGYVGASEPTEHGELPGSYSLEGISGFGEMGRTQDSPISPPSSAGYDAQSQFQPSLPYYRAASTASDGSSREIAIPESEEDDAGTQHFYYDHMLEENPWIGDMSW